MPPPPPTFWSEMGDLNRKISMERPKIEFVRYDYERDVRLRNDFKSSPFLSVPAYLIFIREKSYDTVSF